MTEKDLDDIIEQITKATEQIAEFNRNLEHKVTAKVLKHFSTRYHELMFLCALISLTSIIHFSLMRDIKADVQKLKTDVQSLMTMQDKTSNDTKQKENQDSNNEKPPAPEPVKEELKAIKKSASL